MSSAPQIEPQTPLRTPSSLKVASEVHIELEALFLARLISHKRENTPTLEFLHWFYLFDSLSASVIARIRERAAALCEPQPCHMGAR